ncbi:hypothetical protein [Ferruginivarius sediminum]|uniref:Uncharacterized protein n=1 Tax=Ferruginivarius sediminum TaxID=2661937 RepID=A0A369TBY0_9PROT|nr:hypothetical protein [Ferruginivarius sediminum]RDD61905.1 hypothetical protein DRB17_10470 [Ferruginivarius sediminum]
MAEQDGWKLAKDGRMDLSVLTGLRTQRLEDGDFAIQFQYLTDASQAIDEPHILQLGMSKEQLNQLADGLKQAAQGKAE